MRRYANSIWIGALAGALMAILPPTMLLLALTVRVDGPAPIGPSPDPRLIRILFLLSVWVSSGAVNGVLGVYIGRRESSPWVLLPASIFVPAALLLME
jgi:hypothetical protein